MNLLPQNELLLRKRFPDVLQRMQEGILADGAYRIEDADKGPRLWVQHDEREFLFYGKSDPDKLARRWLELITIEAHSLYAVTGFGLGNHLRAFLKKATSETMLYVSEKEPALLREAFSRIDFSDLLADERFFLATGDLDDHCFKDLQHAALLGVKDIDRLVFSPAYSTDESYYDRMRNELFRQYLVLKPLIEVNLRTATNLQQNTFRNLPFLLDAPDVGQLAGEFANIPLILVGAGPSLDESLEFLQAARPHAIIACSNSSYQKLVNAGIKPHLTVTADPLAPTMQGYLNVSLEDVWLAAPLSAYPPIIEKFAGRVLTWSTNNPIMEIIRHRASRAPGTPIMEQGTVSGCILDLARVFGCSKVLFVGQDMAMKADGQYYTDDSFYADQGTHFADLTRTQNLPGNTLETVPVESRLFVYLRTFEQFVEIHSHIEYANLARLGVKVKGVPYMNFDEALPWIQDHCSEFFDERMKSLFSEETSPLAMSECLRPTIEYTERLLEATLDAAMRIENLPDKFANPNYADNPRIRKNLKQADQVNSLVDASRLDYSILFEGKTKVELVAYK
ncbi:MAG: 6-hydroxymethylpterin diphosphokinase MptE-like protein, partial [Opitutales bacterium]